MSFRYRPVALSSRLIHELALLDEHVAELAIALPDDRNRLARAKLRRLGRELVVEEALYTHDIKTLARLECDINGIADVLGDLVHRALYFQPFPLVLAIGGDLVRLVVGEQCGGSNINRRLLRLGRLLLHLLVFLRDSLRSHADQGDTSADAAATYQRDPASDGRSLPTVHLVKPDGPVNVLGVKDVTRRAVGSLDNDHAQRPAALGGSAAAPGSAGLCSSAMPCSRDSGGSNWPRRSIGSCSRKI